jgi:hypothetical protein
MEDFVEICVWGRLKLPVLRRFLPFERDVHFARHAQRRSQRDRSELFEACFARWVETLRDGKEEVVVIDGKSRIAFGARFAFSLQEAGFYILRVSNGGIEVVAESTLPNLAKNIFILHYLQGLQSEREGLSSAAKQLADPR